MKPFEEKESRQALETVMMLAEMTADTYNINLLTDALETLQNRVDDVRDEIAIEKAKEEAKYAVISAIQEYFVMGGYFEISDSEGDINETVADMKHFESCVEFMM